MGLKPNLHSRTQNPFTGFFSKGGLALWATLDETHRFGGPLKTLAGSGPLQSTIAFDTKPTTTIPTALSAVLTEWIHGSSFFGIVGSLF